MKHTSNQSTPAALTTNCPKSGQPVIDKGSYFAFPGFPGLAFHQKICGTPIGVEEYGYLLSHVGEPDQEHKFVSKEGKPFKARLVFTGSRIEFFRVLDHTALCPKTNKPASITEKAIYFEGYVKFPFWVEFHFRLFSAQDWVKVLSKPEGCTFDDFPSRSGALRTGRVWFDPAKNAICFEYQDPA
jgi:hypothetical protein